MHAQSPLEAEVLTERTIYTYYYPVRMGAPIVSDQHCTEQGGCFFMVATAPGCVQVPG